MRQINKEMTRSSGNIVLRPQSFLHEFKKISRALCSISSEIVIKSANETVPSLKQSWNIIRFFE